MASRSTPEGEQGDGDGDAGAVLARRAVHQRGDAVLGHRVQHLAVLGRALLDDRAVGTDHPVRRLAVAEDRAQLVQVAVADHRPELGAVRRVGQRQIHVPHAGQLDVRPLELLVGGIAEVEDRVQAQGREERGVRLGRVREMAAAEQPSVRHPPAVHRRQAAHITEVAHSGQLGLGRRDLLRHGGSSHSAADAARRRSAFLDDTTSIRRPMSCPQALPGRHAAHDDVDD